MWKLLAMTGVLLIGVALFYFLKLASYLLNSYEFTDYGYGILTGKILILISGIILLYLGFNIKKKQKSQKH